MGGLMMDEESFKDAVIGYALLLSILLTAVIFGVTLYFNHTRNGNVSGPNYGAGSAYNVASNQVIVDLITWNSINGYNSIQWNRITELDIFHMWVNANGTLSYDGNFSDPNLTQIISSAHADKVNVVLSVGGNGENSTIINRLLANSTLGQSVITNIVNQVQYQHYDGVKMDFEGYYNQSEFTQFMRRLSYAMWSRNRNYIVDTDIAQWESSDFNVTQLSPYVTNFEVQFTPSLSYLQSLAQQAGGKSKVSAGYDLTNDSNFTDLEWSIGVYRAAGYSVFFYNAQVMNSLVWNALAGAEMQTPK
jgi:hypothetical protein